MKLYPCPSCERHVRSSESACPFCGQAVAFSCTGPCPGNRALSKAAVVFLGAAVCAACGKKEVDHQHDPIVSVAAYAPAPVDASYLIEPPEVMDAGVVPVVPTSVDAGVDASSKKKKP